MKKFLMNFADSLLSREQMKKVKGGYEDGEQPGGGCPPPGTIMWFEDSEGCGIIEYGFSVPGGGCRATRHLRAYQPCGYA